MVEPTLRQSLILLNKIFGARNKRVLRRTSDRVVLLLRSLKRLEAVHRKFAMPDFAPPLASVFSKISAVVDLEDGVGQEKFLAAVHRKYGTACVYCRSLPCACPTHGPRPDAVLDVSNPAEWTTDAFQRHLHAVYGERNSAMTVEHMMLRLFAEAAEISSELLSHDDADPTVPLAYYEEAADAFAWLVALANRLNVNLQSAVETLYLNGCQVCGYFPCVCRDTAETITL